MQANYFSPTRQFVYACGMLGWSIMINLIGVILVYFYCPPIDSGLPVTIAQVAVLGIFNVVALISAGGRLVDAIYDPFIAQFSDRSTHPRGRRIPLMKKAILPSLLFSFLAFYPLQHSPGIVNVLWLAFSLIGFYVSTTTFIIPYNALLPELAHSSRDKVRLSTWQSVGYVFGIAVSSNAFNIAQMIEDSCNTSRITSLQAAVALLALVGAGFMCVTVFFIDEKKYCTAVTHSVDLRSALKQTLHNRNFILFMVADFSYFVAITIITSGLMYFVTVLLPLHESIGNKLMITMVLVSFIFYPLVNYLAPKSGKKPIIIFSFLLLSFVFLGIYFLGNFPLPPTMQIYGLIIIAAIPLASLNILPNAILAEIISKDSRETGQKKEAIYFAVRYFFVKIAQTVGIALFAMLLLYGKDAGHDLGIRLNGIFGFALCLGAAIIFTKFREQAQT